MKNPYLDILYIVIRNWLLPKSTESIKLGRTRMLTVGHGPLEQQDTQESNTLRLDETPSIPHSDTGDISNWTYRAMLPRRIVEL